VELPELMGAPGAIAWSQRSVSAIREAVRHTAEPVPLAVQLLLTSAARDWTDIAEAAMAPLAEADRVRVLDEVPKEASVQQLLALVWRIVERLREPSFALEVALRRGEAVEGLKTAMRLLLAREPAPRREQVNALLHRVDTSAHLEWALDEADTRLASVAAEIIGQELYEASLSPAEVLKFCEGRPNGPRVLAAWFMQMRRSSDTGRQLRESPALAKELMLWMLRDERLSHDRTLVRQAMEVLRPEQVLTQETLEALRGTRESSRARDVVFYLGPYWFREVADAAPSPERLAQWLGLAVLREWLRDASPGQLFYALSPGPRGRVLPRLAAVIHAWLQQVDSLEVSWIPRLLGLFVEGAPSSYLEDATPDLVPILQRVLPRYEGQYLAVQVLGVISAAAPPAGGRLVERTIPCM
jgi:hypothetical protein